MKTGRITRVRINAFGEYLKSEERSLGTREKYLRDLRAFATWLDGRNVTKERAAEWKEHLQERDYAPVTINSMLAAINGFFRYMGWEACRVRFLKVQKHLFRDECRDLNRQEYQRLIETAQKLGRERLALLLETMGGTGVRVSEVRYITVEATKRGRAEISLKGKIRTLLLPAKLCKKLLRYAAGQKIATGEIFLTASGKSISRRQIWAEMKRLCKRAGVAASKVFPHNLRHLFATAFYRVYRDIARLADVLGHSSIDTTRVYLVTSGAEQVRQLDRLGLVV